MPFGICIFLPIIVCVFFSSHFHSYLLTVLIFFLFFFFVNLANHKSIIKYLVAAKQKVEVYHYIQHSTCASAAEVSLGKDWEITLRNLQMCHRGGSERYFSSVRMSENCCCGLN